MAQPPKLKGLRMEDFKDAPTEVAPTLEKLFGTLNPFLADASSALDKRLTQRDNFAAVYRTVTVTAPDWTPVATTGVVAPYFSLVNNWTNYDANHDNAAYYCDDAGRILFRGLVKRSSGAAVAGEVMITLPSNVTPAKNKLFNSVMDTAHGEIRVRSDSTVTWQNGGYALASLEGIEYSIAAPLPFSGTGWPLTLAATGDDGKALGLPVGELRLVRVTDMTSAINTSHAAAAVHWTTDNKGGVLVHRVGGLSPGRQYKLTFLLAA